MSPDEPLIVPVTFNEPSQQLSSRHGSSTNLVATPGSQSTSSNVPEHADIPNEYHVNMTHIQLMHNFRSMAFLQMQTIGKGDIPPSLFYKHALNTPYIMQACLASSAMHLATQAQDPESRAYYREYTAGLQHEALALFNKAHPVLEVTAENCEIMFLWSALVGVHVLGEAILFERDSLKAFVDRFTTGLRLYRGILTIIDQCKELLFETETGSYLKQSGAQLRATTSRDGPECERLKDMLEGTTTDRSAQQQCLAATLELQRIFNAQRAIGEDHAIVPLIFAWPFFISQDFVRLLQDLHPQALAVFAHYAVLLHRARELWLIGDGGEFLIRAIADCVSSDLQQYLQLPLSYLQDSSMDVS